LHDKKIRQQNYRLIKSGKQALQETFLDKFQVSGTQKVCRLSSVVYRLSSIVAKRISFAGFAFFAGNTILAAIATV